MVSLACISFDSVLKYGENTGFSGMNGRQGSDVLHKLAHTLKSKVKKVCGVGLAQSLRNMYSMAKTQAFPT